MVLEMMPLSFLHFTPLRTGMNVSTSALKNITEFGRMPYIIGVISEADQRIQLTFGPLGSVYQYIMKARRLLEGVTADRMM